jgi:hypothetical protein
MYGTLRGALAGRKIAFDRDTFTASAEGRIVGHGKTIRIRSIHVHYDLGVPPEALEATERALAAHPQGCPAHESMKGAIEVTLTLEVRQRVTHAHDKVDSGRRECANVADVTDDGRDGQAARPLVQFGEEPRTEVDGQHPETETRQRDGLEP